MVCTSNVEGRKAPAFQGRTVSDRGAARRANMPTSVRANLKRGARCLGSWASTPPALIMTLLVLMAMPVTASHSGFHALEETAGAFATGPNGPCVVDRGLDCCEWGTRLVEDGDQTEVPDAVDILNWQWVLFIYVPLMIATLDKAAGRATSATPAGIWEGGATVVHGLAPLRALGSGVGMEGYKDAGCHVA